MVYQDRQPLYFYDLAVHGVFAFIISITLINLFMGTLDNALRSMKSSVTLKLLYKTLKKNLTLIGAYWLILKLCSHFNAFSKLNELVGLSEADTPATKGLFESVLIVFQIWALIVQLHYVICSLSAQNACGKYDFSERELQKSKKGGSKTLDLTQLKYEKASAIFQGTVPKGDASKVPLSQYLRALTNDFLKSLFTFPWVFVYLSAMGLWILFLVLFNNPKLEFFKKNVVFNNSEFLIKTVALSVALTLVIACKFVKYLMSFKKSIFSSASSIVGIIKVLIALNSLLVLGMGIVLRCYYHETFLPVFGVSYLIALYLEMFAFPGLFNAIPYFVVVNLGVVDSRIMSTLTKKNN